MSGVCFQVEISATGRSLVQGVPLIVCVCVCVFVSLSVQTVIVSALLFNAFMTQKNGIDFMQNMNNLFWFLPTSNEYELLDKFHENDC